MFLQTPKRPTLPPTPSTKMSLPPLSSILNSSFTKLPSISDVYSRAYSTPAYTAYGRTPMPKKRKHVEVYTGVSPVLQNSDIHASAHAHRTSSISPSSRGSPNDHISSARITSPVTHNSNVSIVQTQTINAQPTHSAHPPHAATQNSAPTLDKAYAFISHSPATFPSQEPSIDNAPLARRKRRRTSPNELSILNNEFEVGSTPNKMRRLEIAKRVNMTEKAIQIWFQNKRQSLRKQSSHEKEVTELLPVSQSMVNQQVSQLSHSPSMQDVQALASTPAKVTKSYDASPVEADSSVDNSMLVLNETRKKQPVFLNSHSTSTMTFKLIPNNSARVKEKLVLMDKENSRAPSPSISTSSSKTDIKNILNTERIPLGEISANKPKEIVVENLLSLRSGSWS